MIYIILFISDSKYPSHLSKFTVNRLNTPCNRMSKFIVNTPCKKILLIRTDPKSQKHKKM